LLEIFLFSYGIVCHCRRIRFIFTGRKLNFELRPLSGKILDYSKGDQLEFLGSIRNSEEQQQSSIKQQLMMESERLEVQHKSAPTPFEQKVVKNFNVSLEPDQTDLNLDSDQSLKNDIPESLEEPSSSTSQNTFCKRDNINEYGELAIIKFQANRDSHISFRIVDTLSAIWKKRYCCFILKCPFSSRKNA